MFCTQASKVPISASGLEPASPAQKPQDSHSETGRNGHEVDRRGRRLASGAPNGRRDRRALGKDPVVIRKILTHLELPTQVPAPRPPPSDLFDWS